MNRFTSFIVWVLSNLARAYAQQPEPAKTPYVDFVLTGQRIWLLTRTGTLQAVDVRSSNMTNFRSTPPSAAVVTIASDQRGSLVVGDAEGQIKRFDEANGRWTNTGSYTGKLKGLVFNSRNQCFAITNKGILDVESGTTYFPDSTLYLNNQIRNRREWFGTPTYLMDKRNRIWVGFDHGEWGGDVFTFDTGKRTFVRLQVDSVSMSMNPVSTFCEDSQNVYMSGGLSHMWLTHGSILKFTGATARPLLLSQDHEHRDTVQVMNKDKPDSVLKTEIFITRRGGEQIGPITFNPASNFLYYYSQTGLHQGNLKADLSNIKNWPVILEPTLRRDGGRPNAAGPAMSVLKMQFAPDGTLLLLTAYDGFGLYDGKTLRFIL